MPNIDLHTHSCQSPDGSLRLVDYRAKLSSGSLDVVAITDHNTINFALQARQELGEQIIVGEEVMTTDGEIIGLYLTEAITAGLTPLQTAEAIKAQGGLVYIPHPFETLRSGISADCLDAIAPLVDIIEVHNGRAIFQNMGPRARVWADLHHKAAAAASDAHGLFGWGKTTVKLPQQPTRQTLVTLLQNRESKLVCGTVGLRGLAYPKLNRFRKRRKQKV